jgi:nucleotide-binding universal stress UspA family protein
MLRVRRMLLPTDFSPASDTALAPACHWARHLGAELHLFHALESLRPDLYPAELGLADPSLISESLQEAANRGLQAMRRLASNQGAIVTCGTKVGLSPAPTILDYAESHDVDLIVMSTHGRRGVRRLLLGSVAEEVVQRSSCPVLTIGSEQPAHSLSPHRILVAVDLSAHSSAPVAHAKHLAALFGAEVQLLHVLIRPSTPAYYDGVGIPNLGSGSQLLEQASQSALEALYENAGGPGGPFSVHVEEGVAVEQILRFAAANSSDLVIVASHGLTGLSHLLLGSVAERVVRQSPCPVLAIKSFGQSLIAEPAIVSDTSEGRAAAQR